MSTDIDRAPEMEAKTVINNYFDLRTQIVVNPPQRVERVEVSSEAFNSLSRAYHKATKILSDQLQTQREETEKMVSLLLENKRLREEVKELRSRLYALTDGTPTE